MQVWEIHIFRKNFLDFSHLGGEATCLQILHYTPAFAPLPNEEEKSYLLNGRGGEMKYWKMHFYASCGREQICFALRETVYLHLESL